MSGSGLASLYLPFFTGWRLVAIPVSLLIHTAHGPGWLLALLALLLTFGLERLVRRHSRIGSGTELGARDRRRRGLLTVILGLLWLGLAPEEGVIATLIWAATGAAWASATLRWRPAGRGWAWLAAGMGALWGLASLVGPGSWPVALGLIPLFWLRAEPADGPVAGR